MRSSGKCLALPALICLAALVGEGRRSCAQEPTATVVAPLPAVAVAIQGLLADGRLGAGRGADLSDVAADLRRLYPHEAPLPVWAAAPGPVIDELARAAANGLAPENYRAAELASALRAPPRTDTERAWLDVALSAELLRYAAALHGGRVPPGRRRFDVGASPRRPLDRVAVVREIAAGGNAAAALAAIEPRLSLYHELKKALPIYRGLAERAAELPPLGALGKLHPGDTGTDLSGLRALLVLLGDLAPDQAAALVPTPAPAPDATAGPAPAAAAGPTLEVYDGAVVEAVRRFQTRHGLDPDGVIGPQTTRALSVPLAQRVVQIETNLERLRWLPEAAGALVLVNIPEFRLRAYRDAGAAPVLESKVVVGAVRGKHETVAFAAEIRGVAFWPHWNVPTSITRKEQLPKITGDPSYLSRQNMEIVAPSAGGGSEVLGATPEAIEALRSGRARLRQRPGTRNALGRVKFLMPNRYDIYLHDTPSVGLFARSRRDFSHGCVRVEQAGDLAEFVLAGIDDWDRARIDAAMAASRTRHLTLPQRIPVWVTYLTAVASGDGTVWFFDDIYDRDAALERELQ